MRKTPTVFARRMADRRDELRALYLNLYNSEDAFAEFCALLEAAYKARKKALRDLDTAREKDPDWYKRRDILGMLMYTQCFGGTLQGVREHLDYLRQSNVNYVHLMPLLQSPKDRSDGGYAVADFRRIQPELGTMEDLALLADDCHANNMVLCLDFVMNHTSEEHEWAVRARKGEKEYQARYFFHDDRTIPDMYEKTVPQVFPTTAPGNFTYCKEAKKTVMTMFYPYQWDLNYTNPAVFNAMVDNMLFLCNVGVDVIRLDAVPYIWKALGTDCRNRPEVHLLVRMMRLACEIVCPGTLLLGEVVMEPQKVVPYFGSVEKPECHMLYNVTTMATTWHTVATRDVRLLRHQMDTVFSLPKEYTFLNYLRCHDDIGWGLDYAFLRGFGIDERAHKRFLNDYFRGMGYPSDARGELYNDDPRLGDARLCGTTASLCGLEAAGDDVRRLRRATDLFILLHAFLLTQNGIPVLYSGDEIGQLNDSTYRRDPLKRDDSRYIHRGAFSWADAARRTDPNTTQGTLYKALLELEGLRRAYGVFNAQARCWTIDSGSNSVLALGRYFKGEKLIALFNFAPTDQTAWIHTYEDYTDLRSAEEVRMPEITLPPYGFKWLMSTFHQAEDDLI